VLSWVVVCLLVALGVPAQESPKTEKETAGSAAKKEIDPKAKKILEEMSDFLAEQKDLEIRFTDTYDRLNDKGQLITYSHERVLSIARPDHLRFDVKGDIDTQEFFYDGKTLTAYRPEDKVYAVVSVPPTIDTMLDEIRKQYRVEFPAADVARSDIAARLMKKADTIDYVGLHRVRGIECHHLALEGEGAEAQLWIENSKTPYIRKAMVIYYDRPGEPRYTMTVDQVKPMKGFPDDFFTFTPPAGAEKIEFHPASLKKGEKTNAQ